MRKAERMRGTKLLLLGLVISAAACGDDDGTTGPTGTLEITTATTGVASTDYTIIVDGASPRTIAASATLTIADVGVGTHIVQLAVPTECIIDGDNPRTVSVTEGATTIVAFGITCSSA
jgi:hypothetical protein